VAKCSIFPFLELPAELRNLVYEIIYVATTKRTSLRACYRRLFVCEREVNCERNFTKNPTYKLNAALLLVNKQIHSEASELLWAKNDFTLRTGAFQKGKISSDRLKEKFPRSFPFAKLRTLSIIVDVYYKSGGPACTLRTQSFEELSGLKELRICVVNRHVQSGYVEDAESCTNVLEREIISGILLYLPKKVKVTWKADIKFQGTYTYPAVTMEVLQDKFGKLLEAREAQQAHAEES
jgi:hypothetical protein